MGLSVNQFYCILFTAHPTGFENYGYIEADDLGGGKKQQKQNN